uniref:Gypsy retrotransposon integrase-like protein 1 n=1 Tax=Paramormyrops kingsleyae TaxID=1676925 RepID=A0A3B3RBJ3_9TELE
MEAGIEQCPMKGGKERFLSFNQNVSSVVALPGRLVGSKCTARVIVEGASCDCLLDTGSQVTTIAMSFYKKHLSEHPIKPINDLLEVEGANGQAVPYLGYMEISIKFPKDFFEAEPEISTLALIVPDLRLNNDTPLLIGTNTLDPLYDQCCDKAFPYTKSPRYGYKQVLKVLEVRKKRAISGRIGMVRLKGRTQEVLPAGKKLLLEGVVRASSVNTEQWALLEQPSNFSLPRGVFVDSCLIALPENCSRRIPVLLRNETHHDIALPLNCVIAELIIPELIFGPSSLGCDHDMMTPVSCLEQQQSTVESPGLQFDFGALPLSEEWKARISERLGTFSDVFSCHDLDFGYATRIRHHIKLKDETRFKQRSRPIHPHDFEAVKRHLQTLLEAGIIRESESPFASPIVVVRKKNGDVRLCVDYRKLNSQTIKDAYALPNLEESFSALAGSQWFSVMDLKSGYYQVEMNEEDKLKTAFVCPFGFYEFNRMPQGVTNAPSTFQRLMEKCMKDINLKEVLVFLDDLIVFSSTLEDHETRLTHVLERLREYGLKLSPDKCKFFQTSVRYLGHIVSRDGVSTDPEKVQALKTWPRPQTLRELQSFLGFTGYYRRFVKDYSKIVRPLTCLTAGYPPRRKGYKAKVCDGQYLNPKEPFGERWNPACQRAFQAIIEKLTSSPVLAYADPKLLYLLHTDASMTGLGAALYQEHDGKTHVIAYASRGLSRSESRYPAHKLEFLALKWAITEKFQDYLYGNTFSVVTDNNPLTYILTTAKLDAAGYRWLAALSTYDFSIRYRSGKHNMDADGLSRRPHNTLVDDITSQEESQRIDRFKSHLLSSMESIEPQSLAADVVQAVCQKHAILGQEQSFALVESLALSTAVIPAAFEDEAMSSGLLTVPKYSHNDLGQMQKDDPVIGRVIHLMEAEDSPSTNLKADSPEFQLILKEWKRFEIRGGVLYRKRICEGGVSYQLVLPEVLRSSVLQNLHDDMGHLGIERTLDLVRWRFYWPRMAAAVERKVKTCERCVRRKARPGKAAPLVNIQTTRPMELVCMDFLSIEPDSRNTKDILVITDHFTKYAVAIPTRDQKASTVAKCLWEHFLVHYGFPEKLHSDQGRDFESHTIRVLCSLLGIRKTRTSPYHPQGNPVERYNRTLLSMLGTLKDKEKTHWRDYVKPLTHAYNCTKNDVTGFSSYELMFGRQPRLPIDVAFGLPVGDKQPHSHSQYVRNLRSHLEESYQIAIENAHKVAEKNKRRVDKSVRESTLGVGDRVLVRNLRLRNKHKLADHWEPTIYVVTKRMGDLPVYALRPEKGGGPLRTLHRDLLLPCGFLPEAQYNEPEPVINHQRPKTRSTPVLAEENYSVQVEDDDDDYHHFDIPVSTKERRFITHYDIPQGDPANEDLRLSESKEPPRPVSHNPDFVEPGFTQSALDEDLPQSTSSNGLKGRHLEPSRHLAKEIGFHSPDAGQRNQYAKLPAVNLAENLHESILSKESFSESGKLLSPSIEERESCFSNVEPGNLTTSPTESVSTGDSDKNGGAVHLPSGSSPYINDASAHLTDSLVDDTVRPQNQNYSERQVKDKVDEQMTTGVGPPHRRSLRHREPSRRLEYPTLGNPLVTVVKSLFQGLSAAFISSLNSDDSGHLLYTLELPITEQPCAMQQDVHDI